MNEVDEAHNFNTYFPRNNPNRLLEKYTKASLKNLGRSRKKRVSRCLMGTDTDSLYMTY